jgi:hypothetical protein
LLGKLSEANGDAGWLPPPSATSAGFHVRKVAAQTLTPNVDTALTFEVPVWVQGGVFSGSRFTASVPGWYIVCGCVRTNGSSSVTGTMIWVNGLYHQSGNVKSGTVDTLLFAIAPVYLNGSTDFVEFAVYSNIAQPITYASSRLHQFFGFRFA